ncbi:MAG: MerR family transcriptional regulator [Gemmatimonadaceae bacterium]|jgi:DNA-binding transcriptional MerR regulator|nr:MerR family transcriptional regulator [Gemmatimonadaceae bacterium]MCC6431848.1 MerR family transcriptional regulator [Gemmatimonadaceae bacterium]
MAARGEPIQEFYSIGEVCELTELKPHVLRYWESQFKLLNPAKNRSGNRVYARREVELILLVKHLLYTEKYTIDGARQKLDEHRKGGSLRTAARAALEVQAIESIERELAELQALLDERPIPPRPAVPSAPSTPDR